MKRRGIVAGAIVAAFAAASAGGALGADDAKNPKDDSASSGTSSAPSDKSASGGSSQKKGATESAKGAGPNAPLIVLVPLTVAAAPDFSKGCWARLHDSTDLKGNQLTLVGPVDMPNMRTAFGTDWSGQFDSLEVGPKATLTVYDNENYAQKAATFKPGQKVRDLDEKMGTFEQIRSAKISCSGGAKTAQQKQGGASSGSGKGGSNASASGK